MDIVTDATTGLQFCVLQNSSTKGNISEYNLINWCEQFVTPHGIFVDIGSNIGAYSIILGKKCKKVYAFEASSSLFGCSAVTKCINNAHTVQFENVALGSLDGTGEFYYDNNLYKGSLKKMDGSMSSIGIKKLDSYNLSNIDFIRIDTGGTEYEVIKGASMTLVNNNFPSLIFENPGSDFRALKVFLEGLGYIIHNISGYPKMYLASDNVLRKKSEPENPAEPPKMDIIKLKELYKNGNYDEITSASGEWVLRSVNQWDPWLTLATDYRCSSNHAEAYDCAIRGLKMDPPQHEKYRFYEEISIVAFYLKKLDEGYDACEKVILSENSITPWVTRNYILNNQSYYMSKLVFDSVININYNLPQDYIGSSASINGSMLNLRAVNYSINAQGGYMIRDPNNHVITKNFLLPFDGKTVGTEGVELIDRSGVPLYPKDIKGLEDIRLFGDHEFFCTYLEVNDAPRVPQMCYGRYHDDGTIYHIRPMQVNPKLECEKNWLPFIIDGEIHFIYSFHPFKLYKLDRDSGTITLIKDTVLSNHHLSDFRGSAPPIRYQNQWLCTIHQYWNNSPRKYFHRFVLLDDQFTTIKYSKIWFFESPSIEYTLSLAHSSHGLLIPYSLRDNISKIGVLSYETLDKLFE
jgi:FkbM family methyltransferase